MDWLRGRRGAVAQRLRLRPSTARRVRRRFARIAVASVSIGTFVSAVLVAQPPASASAPRAHLPAARPYVRHAKIIGHIESPLICTPGPGTPPPSASTLAYLAESSNSEVQVVDEATGAFVGSPITVG